MLWLCILFLFPALQFGDPHFVTMDTKAYTFNGIGDYNMVTVNDGSWTLHARMQRPEINGEAANGTAFTAFAAQAPNSPKLHIGMSADKTSQLRFTNSHLILIHFSSPF